MLVVEFYTARNEAMASRGQCMSVAFRFTSRDLKKLPDFPGVRYEIIEGELYVSRQPQLGHQFAADAVLVELRTWNQKTGLGQAYSVPGLVFSTDNDCIPDVV